MKPRLLSLELTDEDSTVLMLATQRTWLPAAAVLSYMRADRRDADLMLRLARCLPRHDGRPAVHWLMSIDLSGWLD
jgi:hypothetical protein